MATRGKGDVSRPHFFWNEKNPPDKKWIFKQTNPPPPPPTHIYTLAHFWISVKRLRFEVITPPIINYKGFKDLQNKKVSLYEIIWWLACQDTKEYITEVFKNHWFVIIIS